MLRLKEREVKMVTKMSTMAALIVSLLLVASNAQANLFTTGDMENGGNATTAPLYWSSNGTGVGQGTVGVSTDTPSATGQSLRVEGWDFPGYDYTTYSHDYSDQSGHPAGDYLLSYDYKGDVYVSLDAQNGSFVAAAAHTEWYDSTSVWTHVEDTVTVAAGGVNGFSFYFYDRTGAGNAAYLDNLSLVAAIPEPATMALLGMGGLALLFCRRK